jgi:hypothetical protein
MADKSPGKSLRKSALSIKETPGCQARQGHRVDTDCAQTQALTTRGGLSRMRHKFPQPVVTGVGAPFSWHAGYRA